MIKNYFISSIRNIVKTKEFTAINLVGLAIGMAACLIILIYVNFEESYDKDYNNHERIFRLRYERTSETGETVHFSSCCPPLGLRIRKSFPEVEKVGRIWRYIAAVSYKENVFIEERMFYAEPEFFEIFNHQFISGDPVADLKNPGSAFISESTAKKYFGNDNALGRSFSVDKKNEYQVKGVFKDIPANSHLKFDIILSWANLYDIYGNDIEESWGDTGAYTYLLFKKGANISAFTEKIKILVNTEIGEIIKEYKLAFNFPLQPLTEIHLTSHFQQEYEVNGNKETVEFLKVAAILIIIIAWVNYINLSTARSMTRAREVGIRKVIGATKVELVKQFFLEIILINLVALILAILMVEITLPYFSFLTNMPKDIHLWSSSWFLKTILILLVVGVILSGAYPVLLLSSYKPLAVIKGEFQKLGSGISLRKTLVVSQFTISLILLSITLAVYYQIKYLKSQDLGFTKDHIVAVRAPRVREASFKGDLRSFKNDILNNPAIENFCVLTETPGKQIYWDAGGIFRVGSNVNKNYQIVGIDYGFVNLFETKIIAGRNFSPDFPSDSMALILNETAVRWMEFPNIESAIGGQISYWGQIFTVVGVMQDYHQQSPKAAFEPHIYRLLPYGRGVRGYFAFKLNDKNVVGSLDSIRVKYNKFFPNNPFDFYFLDDYYDRQYKADLIFGKVFGIFSLLAILVTNLGILGLFSFMITQRTKEISIRKIVGAGTSKILFLFSKELLWLLIISTIISIPISFYIINLWLNSFSLKMPINLLFFIIPFIILTTVGVVTAFTQIMKIIRAKPVDTLRYE